MQQQTFRSESCFRLREFEMTLFPMYKQGSDIRGLAKFLPDKYCRQLNRFSLSLSRSALETIRRYCYPDNIRELANTIKRMVII